MKVYISMMRFILVLVFLSINSLAGNLSSLLGGGGCSSSGVSWAGYTSSTYNGQRSFIKGFNALCHSEYPGSHGCTYDEIIKLGNNYPYTDRAWVIDGVVIGGITSGTTPTTTTKDGRETLTLAGPNCYGWGSMSSSVGAAVMTTSGYLDIVTCDNVNKIPCCK